MFYIATSNSGKLRELEFFVKKFFNIGCQVSSQVAENVIENGATFTENSYIKANALAQKLRDQEFDKDYFILADDSGISVDALDGEPGINSARYSGIHGDAQANIKKLIKNIKNIKLLKDRTAHYTCALCLIVKLQKQTFVFESLGILNGYIGFEVVGESGFGYDPIFHKNLNSPSYGQLNFEEKSIDCHRSNSFQKLTEELAKHSYLKDLLL